MTTLPSVDFDISATAFFPSSCNSVAASLGKVLALASSNVASVVCL